MSLVVYGIFENTFFVVGICGFGCALIADAGFQWTFSKRHPDVTSRVNAALKNNRTLLAFSWLTAIGALPFFLCFAVLDWNDTSSISDEFYRFLMYCYVVSISAAVFIGQVDVGRKYIQLLKTIGASKAAVSQEKCRIVVRAILSSIALGLMNGATLVNCQ